MPAFPDNWIEILRARKIAFQVSIFSMPALMGRLSSFIGSAS